MRFLGGKREKINSSGKGRWQWKQEEKQEDGPGLKATNACVQFFAGLKPCANPKDNSNDKDKSRSSAFGEG
jgi:hypothetical protein